MLGRLKRRQNLQEMPIQSCEATDENPILANLADLDLLLQNIDGRKIEGSHFYYFPVSEEEVAILKAGYFINCGDNEDTKAIFDRLRNMYTHCIVSSDAKRYTPNGSHPV